MKDKRSQISLIIIILLLSGIVALTFSFYNYIQETQIQETESENLRILKLEEENNLRSELDQILEQYDYFRDEIDDLNVDLADKQSEIDELKKEIRELLNTKNDLKLAREKIEQLQNIAKKYFAQVDSLLGKTEKQKAVIDSLKLENKEIVYQNQDLNQKNTDLNAKLDLGSSLKIYNVEIYKIKFGNHGQERSVKKAKNIQVLRSCFTISSNPIAESENKLVFIQYIGPDNKVLVSSDRIEGNEFMIGDSSAIATTFTNFSYNNDEIELCVDWQRRDALSKGDYIIRFYIEGKIAGEFNFSLN